MNVITLHPVKNQARVDSHLLAERLGIQHKNVLALIDQYRPDFEEFGPLAFQTRKGCALPQGGFAKSTRVALLNEDQSYLLMTFSRNTPNVRALKVELVKAFARFRQHRQADSDYLPYFHEMHDQVKAIAETARRNGSTTPEQVFHINMNRMINKAFGLMDGQRGNLPGHLRAKITAANVMVSEILQTAQANGLDHKAAYRMAKQAVHTLAACGVKQNVQVSGALQ